MSGPPTIALVGNPNTGKTTLFNALTGFRRHVANYPGVTVDAARGPIRGVARPIELLDLPGTYSLAAAAPDELLVAHVLQGRIAGKPAPDAILFIADASNLPRNLYLLSQLLELDLPLVVALNMTDVSAARGLHIDAQALSARLGAPVVPIVATRGHGLAALRAAIEQVVSDARSAAPASAARAQRIPWPRELAEELAALRAAARAPLSDGEALRLLLDPPASALPEWIARGGDPALLTSAVARLARAGIEPTFEARLRYQWISGVLDGVLRRPDAPVRSASQRIDRVLTHRFFGGVILLAVLFVLFQSIFAWAVPLMDVIDGAFSALASWSSAHVPGAVLSSLVSDGIIKGVGGVLIFLPQIMILFAFIGVLEDCGYLARAAYMMDRIMRGVGLSGRAFIPLLSSFACAVPAIMGARTISDRNERLVTILIAPFMSCSARLPVYVLMISAFVPATTYLGGWVQGQGLVMMAMYMVGVVAAIPIAWLLRKTVASGPGGGFLLELPGYKWPRVRTVWQRVWFAARKFLISAGTVILVMNLIVWSLGYFPRSAATRDAVLADAARESWDEARTDQELAGAYLRTSFLGRAGHAIEPLVRPLGWDWRIAVAVIASFPAREVVIGTMGTIYNLGSETGAEDASLRDALKSATWPETGRPIFTLATAVSLMVFFALCAQCSSTLVIIAREAGSWKWAAISFFGMTTIAYLGAWGSGALVRAIWG